jgi:sulfur carrier protein
MQRLKQASGLFRPIQRPHPICRVRFFIYGRPGMDITVNGITEQVAAETVAALVHDKGLNPKALVVEHNGQVIHSEQWAHTRLCRGDRLELLSFVGGG